MYILSKNITLQGNKIVYSKLLALLIDNWFLKPMIHGKNGFGDSPKQVMEV